MSAPDRTTALAAASGDDRRFEAAGAPIAAQRAPSARPTLHRVAGRTLGITAGLAAAQLPGILLAAWPTTFVDMPLLAAEMVAHWLALASGIALVLELHEHRHRWGDRAPWATAATVVLGLALALLYPRVEAPWASARIGLIASLETFRLHETWVSLFATTLALAYLMQRGVSLEAEARVQRHALQWHLARRRVAATEARAAHLRLDARTLLETLRRTEDTFRRSVDAGDDRLEALTTYLRVVLQASRAASTTLADEVAIARARLQLEPGDRAFELLCDAAPDASAAPVPPGLLPDVLRDWAGAADDLAGRRSFRLHAERSGATLALRIDGPAASAETVIAAWRRRPGAPSGEVRAVRAAAGTTLHLRLELADES